MVKDTPLIDEDFRAHEVRQWKESVVKAALDVKVKADAVYNYEQRFDEAKAELRRAQAILLQAAANKPPFVDESTVRC